MNDPVSREGNTGLAGGLRAFLALCKECLALTAREHQVLTACLDYKPGEFYQKRKVLLPGLDSALLKLRSLRKLRQQIGGVQTGEIKMLSQTIQALLVKILLLDRESQLLLLRRGLVPVRHLPSPAGQQPNYVADLYRRNSRN